MSDADYLLNQPHLNLRVEADAREGADRIVQESETPQDVVAALYGVAQGLLRSTSSDLMTSALQTIFQLVPAAQRISLVAWPPVDGGPDTLGFAHMVPPQLHPVWGKDGPAISRSLVTRAVESRRALLFSHSTGGDDLAETASIVVQRIRSAVYVPLIGESDAVLGVLCVDTPQPWMPFTVGDFDFIRALGALLAASLDAQRLRDEARQKEMEARESTVRREAMSAFLKIASHDLKGPLAVVHMASFALQRDALPEQQPFIEYIQNAARSARSLIDTYLQACAVDSGKPLVLVPERVNPRQVVADEVRVLLEVALEDRAHQFTFVNDVCCEDLVADAEKLRQVFANLISNACKYSPDGGTVRIASVNEPDRVVFSVSDTGIGITEADQARLFQQFQRVGDTALASGSGLGLWLVQALVLAHGGTLHVESQPGLGSTFRFSVATHLPRPA